MTEKVAIVYNYPVPGRLHSAGEDGAVIGVLDSVSTVSQALQELGFDITTIPLMPPFQEALSTISSLRADLIFNLFEGFDDEPGSEAALVAVLEKQGLCFTGSPSSALELAQNKSSAKKVLRAHGIATADWQVLSPDNLREFNLRFPCIIKPIGEHASHGISQDSYVDTVETMNRRIEFIFRSYRCASLVEEFLTGREFCVLLAGNTDPILFPIEEIIYSLPSDKPCILTYAAKWIPEDIYFTGTRNKCPAEISPELTREIEAIARAAFTAIGCRGYARVDMRCNALGQPFVIEVNPNPDISSAGGARLQAEMGGWDYNTMIARIISLAQDAFVQIGGTR